jgi:hypothetical protein
VADLTPIEEGANAADAPKRETKVAIESFIMITN